MGQEEFTYFPWWRLTAKMVGDDETRQRFVTNGAVESIRLTRYAVTADRERLSEEFELRSKISGPDQQQDLKARVGSWFSRKQHGESVAATDAAKEVAAIVSQDGYDSEPEDDELWAAVRQLVEDALEAECQKQLDSYRSECRTAFTDEDADLSYEPTDPKHPGFLNRLGA